ncbi:MAG: efflux RND transporter periplasmic adaptor subunit [Acidobacteriia bacterium]|nr:efflux RND transporter periplasmic adaptor subunit [Terriglobia bacterium]
MKDIRRVVIPLGAVVLLAVATILYFVFHSSRLAPPLQVSGNIEVTDVEVSFKIPGRVQERLVDEGDMVAAGAIVARLESRDLAEQVAMRKAEARAAEAFLNQLVTGSRPEEIVQAEAMMRQSQARLDELLHGSRSQEIAAAQAAVTRTRADAERARLDYERYARLFEKVNVSAQQYDAAKAGLEMAQARQHEAEEQMKLVVEGPRKEQIEQAREALVQAKEKYALVRKGPRQEEIDQARARLEQAREALAMAETQFGYALLTAPLPGVVLSKNVEPGEMVAPGTPVITIGDLEKVWVRAYINETDLGRVKVGQRATVTTDTYPGKQYTGHVSFIASKAEFTPKNVQTEKERVKLVYRIKVDILNPRMELKPGMPADAAILLENPGGESNPSR